MKIHPVFHVALLRKLTIRDPDLMQPEDIPEPPVLIQDHEEFEVETILDKKVTKHGRGYSIKYLIKWKGYPLTDATWEPLSSLGHAQETINDYEIAHPDAPKPPASLRPTPAPAVAPDHPVLTTPRHSMRTRAFSKEGRV